MQEDLLAGDNYDNWFRRECLPFLRDREKLAFLHLQKQQSDPSLQANPDFASLTFFNLVCGADSIAAKLYKDHSASISARRDALTFLILIAPGYAWREDRIDTVVVQELLTIDDPDDFASTELVRLCRALLLNHQSAIFQQNKTIVDEVLQRACVQLHLDIPIWPEDQALLLGIISELKTRQREEMELLKPADE